MEIKNNITIKQRKKYPFDKMEVAQCLEIKVSKSDDIDKIRANAISSARGWAKYNKNNIKFSCSTLRDEGIIRIWRIQ